MPTKNMGNSSGNVLLMALHAEREAMVAEQAELQLQDFIRRHTRACPGCDTITFIPSDDYICEGCRNEGL